MDNILHIAFFYDGKWNAYLKTDELTTYNVYSASGVTRYEALTNLVQKMERWLSEETGD